MTTIIQSDYNNYVNTIKKNLTLNENDWYFKQDSAYNSVLEHVSKEVGVRYYNEIKSRFNNFFTPNKDFLIELCKENDRYGKTQKTVFEDFTICSPTNLRYILHSFLIFEYIIKKGLNNLNIIEIGGGYGGLCFFLNRLSSYFDIKINSYMIFDLLEASQLQSLYLKNLKINNFGVGQIDNFKDINKNSFLISNYAFSEISIELQKEYTNKLLNPYVSNGIICWNHIPLYQFINKKLDIDQAIRVPYKRVFNDELIESLGLPKMSDYTLNTNNNWVEETVVTF